MSISNNKKVAIVGGGPAGLLTAILLREQGIQTTILERADGIAALPQAHVVNTRTCEILRELGLFERMAAAASKEERMNCVTWSSELAGTRFGCLPLQGNEQQKAFRRQASPVRTLNMGQHIYGKILLDHLRGLGGDVLFRQQVLDAVVDGMKAVLSIQDSEGHTRKESFDYVLACDGAGSVVRRALGIDMIGPPSIARFATCYFKGDLNRYLGKDTGPVHFVANPDAPGIFVSYDLDQTWAFMCVMPPGAAREAYSGEVMLELARRAVGDPEVKLELVSVSSWNMSAQVATQFRKGPFFLVGDSAHRFPPTGGLGLNTGAQDAHNLAWKLAKVVRGEADDGLLDTYETERLPVAARNCAHSVANFQKLLQVQDAIEAPFLIPADPTVVERPPTPRRDFGLNSGSEQAKQKQRRIDVAIAAQRPHFDALEIEIGYCYGEHVTHDSDTDYVPVLQAGTRLPHVWLDTAEQSPHSSLDAYAKHQYTLLLCGLQAGETEGQKTLEQAGIGLAHLCSSASGRSASPIFASGSAVLVRPDGHVLWHGRADAENFHEAALEAVQQYPKTGGSAAAAVGEFVNMMEKAMNSDQSCSTAAGPATSSAGIKPKKLAHVVLRSDERYEQMCDWYQDLLSAYVAHRDGMTCFMTFDSEHHRLAVVRVPGMVDRPSGVVGLEHIAFTFETLSDLLETYDRLKAKGVVPILTINHGPTMSIYYEDPDRNRVEMQVDNQKTIEEFMAFVKSGAMDTNPIGQVFDADAMLAKLRAGTQQEVLMRYPVPPEPVDPAVMEILLRN
ncbi:FAD-dependent monooxygenase [Alcaligenes sp. A-TC2]|nr:FAD-dependent monooxygenase [Alcaligenes nematophilus]MCX5471515.1 FAD-dependent monooxygenase [Alcaligenes nematophilus]